MFSRKQVFCEVAYKAETRQDIVDGIDEYIDDLTVLPPSIWDPTTRLAPPEQTMTMVSEATVDGLRYSEAADSGLQLTHVLNTTLNCMCYGNVILYRKALRAREDTQTCRRTTFCERCVPVLC